MRIIHIRFTQNGKFKSHAHIIISYERLRAQVNTVSETRNLEFEFTCVPSCSNREA